VAQDVGPEFKPQYHKIIIIFKRNILASFFLKSNP
jgi:hypothetical protein